jgi:hypothetical protein
MRVSTFFFVLFVYNCSRVVSAADRNYNSTHEFWIFSTSDHLQILKSQLMKENDLSCSQMINHYYDESLHTIPSLNYIGNWSENIFSPAPMEVRKMDVFSTSC